ncbi:MAG TPA: tRNA lysidine(34) synthetase TilS [Bacillales bacterium]|nr:tRNA lysidine(34) synthetase TilS [Bacillales bacterium]
MRQAVDRFIKRHHLLERGAVVVVGVSGGPDSMALLDYLESVRYLWDLRLIAASVDHGFRGKESAADLSYVQAYCREKNITFEGTSLDVNAYRKEEGVSLQEAARECRYEFFDNIVKKFNADYLALAHHGDDQVETMLMRQVRGSSGIARSGIPVRRRFGTAEMIRPFLDVDKRQIEEYCKNQGIQPRRDPSNDSDAYTRNRFRHHVLPFLKKENPNVHVRFQYESERIREDELYLEQLAEARLSDVMISESPKQTILSVEAFSDMPMALQRRVIHLILSYLYRQIPPSLSVIHIEGIVQLLSQEQPSARLDLPLGLQAIRSYGRLVFTYKKEEYGDEEYQHQLDVPGKAHFPVGTIVAEFADEYQEHPDDDDGFVCDPDLINLPLFVRTKRSGDRLSPKGMKGSKKVKAIFIDEKIRRDLRNKWPLVTDSEGTVLWVPGLKHSGVGLPSVETKQRIVLRFRRSGNI